MQERPDGKHIGVDDVDYYFDQQDDEVVCEYGHKGYIILSIDANVWDGEPSVVCLSCLEEAIATYRKLTKKNE